MEKMKILGIRLVDMETDDKRRITGNTLYVGFQADNVQGLQTGKFFVNASMWPALTHRPSVNEEVLVDFGRNGKITNILPIKER